ncbi:MAG: InlB B-repeat-containing protein [Treponema sp.]|nr:InlB B-repeat-containing protein [Treponema sp.]
MMSRAYGRSRGFVLLVFLAGCFLAGCDSPQATPYTVTFEANGGSSVQAQDLVSGGTATEPSPAPTKANLDFGGWHTDGTTFSDATKWDFATAVTEPITLYAKWTANVTINDNDGSSPWLYKVVTEGGTVAKPSYTPSRSDMASFYDWYVNKKKWDFDTAVTAHTTLDAAYKAMNVYGDEIALTKNGTPSTSNRSIPEYVAFPFDVSGSPIGLITVSWYWDGVKISGDNLYPWTMAPYSKAPGTYLLSVEVKSGVDTYKGQRQVTITESN